MDKNILDMLARNGIDFSCYIEYTQEKLRKQVYVKAKMCSTVVDNVYTVMNTQRISHALIARFESDSSANFVLVEILVPLNMDVEPMTRIVAAGGVVFEDEKEMYSAINELIRCAAMELKRTA